MSYDVGDVEHSCHVMADTVKNSDDGMIMIADSGASNHMINTKKGMFDCVKVNERITIGNGKTLKVEMVGKIRAMVLQRNGDKKMIRLDNVMYVPELAPFNLFSVPRAMDLGFKLHGHDKLISLVREEDGFSLDFDIPMKTKSSWLATVKMYPVEENTRLQQMALLQEGKPVETKVLHEVFGHIGEHATQLTADYYKLKSSGHLEP
eukprot:scaffold5477_cov97-Cylindrotheca_fusiformis.AAC.1